MLSWMWWVLFVGGALMVVAGTATGEEWGAWFEEDWVSAETQWAVGMVWIGLSVVVSAVREGTRR